MASPCWRRPLTRRCIRSGRRPSLPTANWCSRNRAPWSRTSSRNTAMGGSHRPRAIRISRTSSTGFHFANGTLQANMGRNMILNRLKLADDNPILLATKARVDRAFDLVDARTREVEYLAGSEFTSADIMMGFSLTTMRYFLPYDLARCPNVVGYLARIGARPAYRRAMEKGDPGMPLLLT